MVTLPHMHQKISGLGYVMFSAGCPRGRRSRSQQCAEHRCPSHHGDAVFMVGAGTFGGSFQKKIEDEVTLCCCAKGKGNSSVLGTYYQAFMSRLSWRLLRGEDFSDGHPSYMITSSHMFLGEREKEGALLFPLNLQQQPWLHLEEKNPMNI